MSGLVHEALAPVASTSSTTTDAPLGIKSRPISILFPFEWLDIELVPLGKA